MTDRNNEVDQSSTMEFKSTVDSIESIVIGAIICKKKTSQITKEYHNNI